MRWAQMVFTEDDPGNYDPKFWLDYFKRTHSDAVCLAGGGYMAFYPTKVPLHNRSKFLGDRDPFGEMVKGCREAGMYVIARTDPHAAQQAIYDAHPDWIAVDAHGQKRRHWANPDLWVTCALGPMNFEFMTEVTKELVQMYGVDGVFSNRWHGSGQCFCEHCRKNFKDASGYDLPHTADPQDPARMAYIVWHEKRLFDLWILWDAEIRKINPNARFIPNSGGGALSELDMRTVGEMAGILFADRQARRGLASGWGNGKTARNIAPRWVANRSIFGHNVTQNLPVLGIQSDQPANNCDSVFTLASGPRDLDPASILTAQPKGPNGRYMLPNGVTAFMISNPIRFPTVDAWNFTIQRQLGADMAFEVGYVGTKSTHVFAGNGGDYDVNQATINGFGTLTTNQRKPFFQKFGWSQNLRYYGSDASNNYHSVRMTFDKRFSYGLSTMLHFTWSKNIDYDGTYYNQDAKLARGPANNNREQVFFIATLYELPFGKSRRFMSNAAKPLDLMFGGWQVNGTYSWMSGQPFTPSYRDCNADRDTGWCRPDLVGDPFLDNPSQFGWFVTADAPLTANGQTNGPWQRPQRGQFGTIGRNFIYGPSFWQMDMSFFKTFPITERFRMQFRAESFNFLNHTNLANPNGCVDCPGTAGRIFGTFANYVPRQWQMELKAEF